MLWHFINRLKLSQRLGEIILAIPESPQNDELELFAKVNRLPCFRGDEQDVLSRYYHAALQYKAEIIVRVTSDCPLIDPRVTDMVVEKHLDSDADYTCNGVEWGFPLGLDTEVFSFNTLERAFKEAHQEYEREHVMPYIYQHPELFKIQTIPAAGKLKRPDLRLTVDTEEDLKLIREIYRRLYHEGQIFYTEDVIDLLDKYPELIAINANVRQKKLGE